MEKYRVKTLKEFQGQEHLVGTDGVITTLLEKKQMKSAIFYGPSGTGKTTLVSIIIKEFDIPYGMINAATNNKSDLVELLQQSNFHNKFLLVIDEIHRMNRDKQDILLPYLEQDNLIMIGLTTFNPYNSINSAIRSRVHIFNFKQLDLVHIETRLNQIMNQFFSEYTVEKNVIKNIALNCNGDIRYAINKLDMLILTSTTKNITLEDLSKLESNKSLQLDKNSDYYFDLLSGFHKSIRGSDADAALHYLAQLINLDDLESICRRLLAISYEDIGLANPTIHTQTQSAVSAARELGLPEAKHPLSFIVIQLCLSPKSNTAYSALKSAFADIESSHKLTVADNVKHHTNTYIYPHDYNGWVNQQYMPDDLEGKRYLKFKNNQHEKKLSEFYEKIHALKNS